MHCIRRLKISHYFFSNMLVFNFDFKIHKFNLVSNWFRFSGVLKDTDVASRRQWEQRMGGFTVWKLHTDVLTDPSKIYCARISNQSRLCTKTDYVDKRDPFDWQAGRPITPSKITTIQLGRSGGGISERGLGARYHGGSVRERQPLKIAEPLVRAPEFLKLFCLNGLNQCSDY